jgi:hypothetical protein
MSRPFFIALSIPVGKAVLISSRVASRVIPLALTRLQQFVEGFAHDQIGLASLERTAR